MTRKCNNLGLDVIMNSEGIRLISYKDMAGVWTIGFGHTKDVTPGQHADPKQVETWLAEDVRIAEEAVEKLVKVPISDNQFSALVSFVYNLGEGALAGSTLLRLLNEGDYINAAKQFREWDHVRTIHGHLVVAPGLRVRRRREELLFLRP